VRGAAASSHRVSFTVKDSGPLSGVVGDPSRPAVWFWSLTKRADVVYRLDATGRVKSWAVLSGKRRVVTGDDESGLAVASDGDVWLGASRTLVRLNPTSGNVRTWKVPAGRLNPRAVHGLSLKGPPRITAVAVSPSGGVAVALWPMSSVTTFDPSTTQFSVVDLPSVDDLDTALAYSNGGTLGVGYADIAEQGDNINHVLMLTGALRRIVVVSDSAAVALTDWHSRRFLAGDANPEIVSVTGPPRDLPAPTSLDGFRPFNQPLDLLSGDRLAGATRSGVIVFPGNARSNSAATARSHLYLTPQEPCYHGPIIGVPPGSATTDTASTSTTTAICRQGVSAVATDAHNDLWIITGTNADTVMLLAHA
jgi:hypothetical protein